MFTILIPYWSPGFNGEKCLTFVCALIAKIKTEVSVVPECLLHLTLTIFLYIILLCLGFSSVLYQCSGHHGPYLVSPF